MINPVTLATTTGSSAGTSGAGAMMSLFLPLILLFVVMWLLMIRPQNKKRKEEDTMRKNAQIGDDITTIGGICGRIVGIKEDNNTLVIETGTDRAKMRIKRWAIGSVDTVHDEPAEQPPKKRKLFGKKNSSDDDVAEIENKDKKNKS
ncbi:MAG TPA: preprotein translocase subunit YajC [Ruminococcaceae bacterium]|jgi:preprotein translocase subunit YajC|nr:preprotein translocase subunit YajC [Oscillospiraceae bacterium]HCC03025.1 preprotein translocase subunit YajC [Oscillospiraceae bacterium]